MLHKVRYSENSLIVKFYTRRLGLLSVIMHGAGKAKSRNKSNLLQPLSLLELEIDYKEKKNIHHLKEMRAANIFLNIPFDIGKSSILLFLNEVLYKSIKEEEPNEALWDFIRNSLINLDMLQAPYQNFHIDFLIHLSGFLGFNPLNNYDASGNKFFHLQEGCFTPFPGPPGEVMNEDESRLLHLFLVKEYAATGMNQQQRNSFLNTVLKYYSHHIPHFPEIKSHRVLKEILS